MINLILFQRKSLALGKVVRSIDLSLLAGGKTFQNLKVSSPAPVTKV
jgi:hypothetical protein